MALADGSGFLGGLIDSWHDLAKTSYGAKLTFEGDVRMYGWKDINNNLEVFMSIKYLGHSCFEILVNNKKILIDPFLIACPDYDFSGTTDIFVTHGHAGHLGSAVEISKKTGYGRLWMGNERGMFFRKYLCEFYVFY